MNNSGQATRPSIVRRQTLTLPVFPVDDRAQLLTHRLSTSISGQHHLSTVPQIFLPNGHEYRGQERVPPVGVDGQRQVVFARVDNVDGPPIQRRLSIVSEYYHPVESEDHASTSEIHEITAQAIKNKRRRHMLFVTEPIVSGIILLPIVVLFWEAGWNLVWILLNKLNNHPLTLQEDAINEKETEQYSFASLIIPYIISQILLLIFYLGQDIFYDFLKNQKSIIQLLLLKCHILLVASVYIVQWEMLWTIWDQYIPHEWYFEFVLSLTSLFALIVLIGHLSDLVCAPFLVSYDSIEYCIHFGCPLLTREMKQWKINFINYILYEIIICNIAIMAWRGSYNFLDTHMYPDDVTKSAWISLIFGYILYFPLMYFQNYLEYLNMQFGFWIFVSINFPQLYRNIRHLFAFLSCVFLWRGFWMLYDTYIVIFPFHYQTFSLLYFISFVVLALIQTSSSINGPLNNMEDDNHFFPLYPNCYVSTVAQHFS